MWHITHAYPCYLEITTPQFQINHTPDPIWRYIWKMNCPPTITLFMWKLTHGILPHRSNLRHRGFQMDTLCPRCQESVEDAEHMLLECDWAQRVWRLSPMGFSFNSGTRLPIREWVCSWLKDSDNDYYKEITIYILWHIWKARNDLIWRNQRSQPHLLLERALEEHRLFLCQVRKRVPPPCNTH